ncbi:uncharacterized protein LOC142825918 isoform X1 [Pelodiscus sinensis]|uniref:uncharacterized protein LOC142825918 isoform X1 n=1 Tax=Pelodiscus sinensis TaxID=13735 RepID=UPI003F6CEEF5
MVPVLLLWVFVGGCSALWLSVPEGGVTVAPGDTALLPAVLRLPAPPPPSFQVRWRFLPTGRLVLLLVAHGCGGAAPWRRACRLGLERGRGYEGRAGLGPRDAALQLRDAGPEDAGSYRVSLLGLGLHASAELNLTLAPAHTPGLATVPPPISAAPTDSPQPPGGSEPPLGSVRAPPDGGGVLMSNTVQLGLAGLVLCLLALIVGEHVLSMRKQDTLVTESLSEADETTTALMMLRALRETPRPESSEELYSSLSY